MVSWYLRSLQKRIHNGPTYLQIKYSNENLIPPSHHNLELPSRILASIYDSNIHTRQLLSYIHQGYCSQQRQPLITTDNLPINYFEKTYEVHHHYADRLSSHNRRAQHVSREWHTLRRIQMRRHTKEPRSEPRESSSAGILHVSDAAGSISSASLSLSAASCPVPAADSVPAAGSGGLGTGCLGSTGGSVASTSACCRTTSIVVISSPVSCFPSPPTYHIDNMTRWKRVGVAYRPFTLNRIDTTRCIQIPKSIRIIEPAATTRILSQVSEMEEGDDSCRQNFIT